MRDPTPWDWIAAVGLWSIGAFAAMVGLVETGAPEEVIIPLAFGGWALGLVGARIWWLRRTPPENPSLPKIGMTTDEMTAQRLAEMESRIFELEERLELTERILAANSERPMLADPRN